MATQPQTGQTALAGALAPATSTGPTGPDADPCRPLRGCRIDYSRAPARTVLERWCAGQVQAARRHSRAIDERQGLLDRLTGALLQVLTPARSTGSDGDAGVDPVEVGAPVEADHSPGADGSPGVDGQSEARDESLQSAMDAELRIVEAVEAAKAALDAQALTALARMTSLSEAMVADAPAQAKAVPFTPEELVAMEVATATGLSQREIGLRAELATGPASRYARLRDLLAAGAVSLRYACQLVAETRHLAEHESVDQIVQSVFAPTRDGAGLTAGLFRSRLRRAVLRADTDAAAAAARRRAARARNGAFAQLFDDGTGQLVVRNDAEKIAAAMDRADAAARAAKAAGDPRSLDQLRADFVTGATSYGQPCPGHHCEHHEHDGDDHGHDQGHGEDRDQTGPAAETPSEGTTAPPSADGPSATSDSDASDATEATDATEDTTAPAPADCPATTSGTADAAAGANPPDEPGPADSTDDARAARDPVPTPCPVVPDWYLSFGRRPEATVWIVVPVTTALGLDDAPCELPGHGWVAAEQARAIITAPGSAWQTLLAHQHTGHAIGLSTRSYRPPPTMIAHVTAVDGTCRGPGCTVPAARCDLDHDIPHPSGPTAVTNLTLKHRQHHRVRTAAFWRAARNPQDASITWRTSAGRRYVTYPTDWLADARPRRPRTACDDHNPEPSRRRFGPEPNPDPSARPDPGPPPF